MPADRLMIAKYRGNAYGVGLKGINALFGQNTADRLIGQLMSTFSDVLLSALAGKRIAAERVWAAQFVDRLTVCCEQPVFQAAEIMGLVGRLAAQFNTVSDEIKAAHFRTSIVVGEGQPAGYRLFHQLALTSLMPQPSILANSDPPIEVRQHCSLTLQEGQAALERNCFLSAKLLAAYKGDVLKY
jgi:hypothetical protein